MTISNVKLTCVGYGNNGIFFFPFCSLNSPTERWRQQGKRKNALGLFTDTDNKISDRREIRAETLLEGGKNPGSTPDRNGWRSDWGKDESRLSPVT